MVRALGILVCLVLVLVIGCERSTPAAIPTNVPVPPLTAVATPIDRGSLKVDVISLGTAPVVVSLPTADYVLTKFRLTAISGYEDLDLVSLTLSLKGTVSESSVINWRLLKGAVVVAVLEQSADGRVIFQPAAPLVIPKKSSVDLTVVGDIVGSPNGDLQIHITSPKDILAIGRTSGSEVPVKAHGVVDTGFPLGDIAVGYAGHNTTVVDRTIYGTNDYEGSNSDVTLNLCTGSSLAFAEGELGNITSAEAASIRVGDILTLVAWDSKGRISKMTRRFSVLGMAGSLNACDGNGQTGRVVTASQPIVWGEDDKIIGLVLP